MTWLMENLSTIIVSGVLLIAVILALRSMHQDKIKGKSSCGGNCGSCGSNCHSTSSLVDLYHHDQGKC